MPRMWSFIKAFGAAAVSLLLAPTSTAQQQCFTCPNGYRLQAVCNWVGIPPSKPPPPPPKPSSAPPPAGSSPKPGGLNDFASTLISKHNYYRARHHVGALQWDSTVATAAQNWINRCQFAHEGGGQYGENLYMSSGQLAGKDAAAQATDMWYDEINQYNWNNPGFSYQTGHATACLWKATTKLGCGIAHCPSGTLISCKYSPPGNVVGTFKENVLPV